jgi:hypothetical protein
MKRIIEIEEVGTTADCVEALNENVKKSKWKRKTKFNIQDEINGPTVVRVFSDGVDTLSIIQNEDASYIVNFNLDSIRPLIDRIQLRAKKIYTFDCGEIFLNPWDMKVWIVGGDGGIIKSELPKSTLAKMVEDGEAFFFGDLDDIDLGIPEITETIVEAEYFPPLYQDEEDEGYSMEWIFVGRCVDLGDFY